MGTKKCPDCGCDISENTIKCPFCDYVMGREHHVYDTPNIRKKDKRLVTKTLGIILMLISVIFIVLAFSVVNSSKYKFYQEHYEDCIDGLDESRLSAITESYLFSSTYTMLADGYKDMASYDLEKLKTYRLQAGILGFLAFTSLIIGIVLMKKERANE